TVPTAPLPFTPPSPEPVPLPLPVPRSSLPPLHDEPTLETQDGRHTLQGADGDGDAVSGTGIGEADGFKAIQLYDSYLVLETPEGMLVIDQHALHERILFEQLKERIRTGLLETQRLLVPEPVDLPPDQAARTLEHKDALAELGLGVEDFGGGTVLVSTYP